MLRLFRALHFWQLVNGRIAPRRSATFRLLLEELESRQAPASFAVNGQLAISRLDSLGDAPVAAHAVVFFESAVPDYQILRQALAAGTDAVVLDSAGDDLKEMAAFLSDRHDLTSIGVVAHGEPGRVALGTGSLDTESLGTYTRQLAAMGFALAPAGELDLWSCDVAAGQTGASLVRDLAAASGAEVAAATHPIGDAVLGGNWQLDVRAAGARGELPFSDYALGAFHEILGTWGSAASMATAREWQTATLLGNGKVLVAGGFSRYSGGPLSSAELYDPVTDTWSSAGSMTTVRTGATATLLRNGKVLVTGGYSDTGNAYAGSNPLSSAELYDPASNTWSAAASMSTPRYAHTATLLGNGMVLVTGGRTNQSNQVVDTSSAELYDPASDTWSAAASMAIPRVWHTATLLGNGKVLVIGGEMASSTTVSSTEVYDPTSNAWSFAAPMPTAREFHTATLLGSGKVLVAGGYDASQGLTLLSSAELYDPASNTWSSASSMAVAREQHTATLLDNGQVLVTGGQANSGYLSSAEIYDSLSNTWSPAGSMVTGREKHTATLLSNGSVLVVGGISGRDAAGLVYESSAELYNLGQAFNSSQSIITVSPASIPIGGTSTVVLTAKDASGNQLTTGGLPFSFGLGTGTGSGTFSNLTDNHNGAYTATFTGTTAGPITITATLNGQAITSTLPTITITSPITTPGLTVTSFSPTATGFTATFSNPFNSADLTLYGTGLHTMQDVTLVGKTHGPISGSLLIDPSSTTITFNATANALSLLNNFGPVVLPDDTYTVTLISGLMSNGFQSAFGARLDGANDGGHDNYTTTFTTHYQADATAVLSIPDFARGPDGSHPIKVPNDTGHGIPITLYNAANVTDVTFMLSYNASLLAISASSSGDATDPAGSFSLASVTTYADGIHAIATFHFQDAKPQSGNVVLGDIVATVPNRAAGNYKAKQLLQFSNILINGGAVTGAVSAAGIQVNAYAGDVTGNGTIDALDVAFANIVAQGTATGFPAYQLLDPAIVGDVAADFSVDAGDVSDLAAYTVRSARGSHSGHSHRPDYHGRGGGPDAKPWPAERDSGTDWQSIWSGTDFKSVLRQRDRVGAGAARSSASGWQHRHERSDPGLDLRSVDVERLGFGHHAGLDPGPGRGVAAQVRG